MRSPSLIFFICFIGQIFGQSSYTQEAELLIKRLKFVRTTDLDSSKLLAKQLKNMGLKTTKENLVGLSYRLLADAYGNFNESETAINHYDTAEKIFMRIDDSLNLADCCNNYSGVLKDNGNSNLAIEKGYQALNLYEALFKSYPKDSLYYFLTAYALNQIAVVFMGNHQELKAIPLLKSSSIVHFSSGNTSNAYRNYLNLASCYEALDKLDSALYYYQLAIPFFEESEDNEALLVALNNAGNLYDKKQQVNLSYQYYTKALTLSQKYNNKRQEVQSLTNLSNIDLKKGLYDACIEKLSSAELIAKKIDAVDFLRAIYGKLKTVYAFKKDLVKFDIYEDRYDSITTVLQEQSSAEAIANAEKKFETEKKDLVIKQQEADIELAETKSRQKNYLIYGGALVLLVVSLLGFLAFRNFLKIRKANGIIKSQNLKLEQSNTEITSQRNELEVKNKEIMESIVYSKYLQNAILPKEEEVKRISKFHFIQYQPKNIVSGDYYWTFNTPNGLSIWATMDCTGHGVPGAMMSMLGITFLNEIVIEKHIYKPSEILNRMREKIITALNQSKDIELKDGMDGSICVWNKQTNQLSYASANSAIWIYRDMEFIELNYNKMPIGKHIVMDPFENYEFQLQSGDWITSMSDGLADQFGGPNNKKMKYKRVRDFLSDQFSSDTKAINMEDFQHFYDTWKGQNEQTDDVTVLGIKIT
jgi:serine phosphatase RsbU (regulator of sigma subunit)